MRRLLIRPGGIGDCLLCLPALESLRTDYTEVWVPTAVVPLICFADRVCSLASTGLDQVGFGHDESVLARLACFDEIVSWYGTNRPEFRECLQRLGVPCRFHQALPSATSPDHAIDFFCRQVGTPPGQHPVLPWGQSPKSQAVTLCPTGLKTPEKQGLSPFWEPNGASQEGLQEGLSPFFEGETLDQRSTVVIHPFSGGNKKNWLLSKFKALATQLGVPVEWTAGPEEELSEAQRFGDLGDLGRWLAGATLYIGNDSGISHLAAASGVPTIVLFGESDPRIWAPRGPNVTILEHHPFQDLPVQKVLDTARNLLPKSR